MEGPVQSAAAGARDIQKLNAVLAKAGDNEWLSVFLRTRLSILQGDWEAIESVATSDTFFDSVFMALEAIDDERALERIRSRIKGETPRDVGSRLIIAAKLASRMGDAAKIDEAIQQAAQMDFEDAEHALIRFKLQLEAELTVAPRSPMLREPPRLLRLTHRPGKARRRFLNRKPIKQYIDEKGGSLNRLAALQSGGDRREREVTQSAQRIALFCTLRERPTDLSRVARQCPLLGSGGGIFQALCQASASGLVS